MNKQKAEKFLFAYNWIRIAIIIVLLLILAFSLARMQPANYKAPTMEIHMVK